MDYNSTDISIITKPSDLRVAIYPLPILNITDHFTRKVVINPDPKTKYLVGGLLLGLYSDGQLEIVTSLELKVTQNEDESLLIDDGYCKGRLEQAKQMFPNLDPIGWYLYGNEVKNWMLDVQDKHFKDLIDQPILLLFDPTALYQPTASNQSLRNRTELPILMYTTTTNKKYSEVGDYFVGSAQDQHVGLEALTRDSLNKEEDGNTVNHLTSQAHTVNQLKTRLTKLVAYLNLVEQGNLPFDGHVMLQCRKLLDNMPTLNKNHPLLNFIQKEQEIATFASFLTKLSESVDKLCQSQSNSKAIIELNNKSKPDHRFNAFQERF